MKFILKNSSRLVFIMLIVTTSLIYGLPHIIMIGKIGSQYNPIAITKIASIPSDKGYAYAPYVNKVIKDGFFLREAYVFEYRNYPTPYVGETYSSNILALLSKLTGSVSNAFLVSDFIFPTIIFLLLYKITKFFIKDDIFAMSAAFFAVILRDIILLVPYPKETYEYIFALVNQQQYLHYSRAFHPQITFPLLAVSLLMLLQIATKPDFKKTIFLGIFIGIIFYAYLFYWTFLVFFLLLTILIFLLKKEYKISSLLLVALTIGFLIGSFYFFNIFQFYKLDFAQDFTEKMTGPSIPYNAIIFRFLLIAALVAIFSRRKLSNTKIIVILFFISGILITISSKLLLGRDLETLHYIRRVMIPVGTIAAWSIVYQFIGKRIFFKKTVAIVIILLTIFSGIKTQINATNILSNELVKNLEQENLFLWLQLNTAKDSVVATLDSNLNELIPSRSYNYVYFPPTLRTITPTNEELERYIILNNLLGIDNKTQKQNLDKYLGYIYFAKVYKRSPIKDNIRIQAEAEIDSNKDGLWKEKLYKYKIDFIIVPIPNNAKINPNSNYLIPATSVDGYVIFKAIM